MKNKSKTLFIMSLVFPLISCGKTNISSTSNSSSTNGSSSSSIQPSTKNPLLERDMKEIALSFSLNDISSSSINPYIYGTFIEHIETCIYNGIWAEVIMDRKFYCPVGKDVSQWNVSKGQVGDDTETPFEGEHSPILNKDSSIRQRGLSLDQKDYNGYIYAKGEGSLKFAFTIDSEVIEKEIKVSSSDYKKYTFDISSPKQTKRASLEISSLSSPITIDSISLMPEDNYYGMRIDTLEKLKELNAPFYRWPGGNFVSGYDFYDGIGDKDKRPTRRNLNYIGQEKDFNSDSERIASDLMNIGSLGFYGAFEPNDFGLDEFIKMCSYLNAEPNIVINAGLGSLEMAKNEVEYCNGLVGRYASMRPQKESYNVKYFSIGNEMNGDWQLGHVDINTYTQRHNEFAKAMKSVDPNIKIIAVGDNSSSWTQDMVNACKDNMDYSSEHFYAERIEDNIKNHILSMKNQAKTRIEKHRNIQNIGNIKMAIDEYAYMNAEVSSRLKDGMGIISGVNEMIKNSDVVSIACYSSTVNATQGQIATDDFNAYLEGSGYALSIYRDNLKDYYLPVKYKATVGDDYYEIIMTVNKEKNEVAIGVINTTDQILKLTNRLFDEGITQDILEGEFLESSNSVKGEELKRTKRTLNAAYVVAEPRSISVTTLKIR